MYHSFLIHSSAVSRVSKTPSMRCSAWPRTPWGPMPQGQMTSTCCTLESKANPACLPHSTHPMVLSRSPGCLRWGLGPSSRFWGPTGSGDPPPAQGAKPFPAFRHCTQLRTGRRGSKWGVCHPQDCGNQQHGCRGQAGAGRWRVLRLQGPGRRHHPGHGHADRSSGGSHCPFCFVTMSDLVCEGAGAQGPWTLEGTLAQGPHGAVFRPSFSASVSDLLSVGLSSVLGVPQPTT